MSKTRLEMVKREIKNMRDTGIINFQMTVSLAKDVYKCLSLIDGFLADEFLSSYNFAHGEVVLDERIAL